jgi:hypothetical protein
MPTTDKDPAAMAAINANPIKRKREMAKQLQEERLNRMELILKNHGRRYPLWTFGQSPRQPILRAATLLAHNEQTKKRNQL